MRKIKFRAWNTRRKTMEIIDDLYWFEENGCHHNGDNDYVIQQYTGLKDKDSNDIYEGDILGKKFTIEFLNGRFRFMYMGLDCAVDPKSMQITGNIFERVDK